MKYAKKNKEDGKPYMVVLIEKADGENHERVLKIQQDLPKVFPFLRGVATVFAWQGQCEALYFDGGIHSNYQDHAVLNPPKPNDWIDAEMQQPS